MLWRPPRSTLTDTLFPYTALFRAGVSLAVYMHGVTKELWHLTRASRDFLGGKGASGSGGTLGVYTEMLRTIERDTGVRLRVLRSEEHTSELQSLMRISYAVFCLKKKITNIRNNAKNSYQKS